jgi:hypothetical protein
MTDAKPTYIQLAGPRTKESVQVMYRAGECVAAAPPFLVGRCYFDWKWRKQLKGLDTGSKTACENLIGMSLLPI